MPCRYLWSSHKNVYGGMGKRKWEQHRARALEWLTAALEMLPASPAVEGETETDPSENSTNDSLLENNALEINLTEPFADGGRHGGSVRICRQEYLCMQDICKRLFGNTRMWGRDAMFTSSSKQQDFQMLHKVLKSVRTI